MPIRRYLRISQHSVIELRIYLDDPHHEPWLLSPASATLPRIIADLKPIIIKQFKQDLSRRKKVEKERFTGPDYTAAVYISENGGRYAVLRRRKRWEPKREGDLQKGVNNEDEPRIREESEERALDTIPDAGEGVSYRPRRSTRRRAVAETEDESGDEDIDDDEFVPGAEVGESRAAGRNRDDAIHIDDGNDMDMDNVEAETKDDKKLVPKIHYEGYKMSGRIICIIIERTDVPSRSNKGKEKELHTLLEDWIIGSQIMNGEGTETAA